MVIITFSDMNPALFTNMDYNIFKNGFLPKIKKHPNNDGYYDFECGYIDKIGKSYSSV